MLDVRNNELLTEGDLIPLLELKELADFSVADNPLSTKANVLEWVKKNMPLIETVDNARVNEAGHRFDLALEDTVKAIDSTGILENEDSKKAFKEFQDKVRKTKDAEEIKVPSTPSKPKSAVAATTPLLQNEPIMAELDTITKQVLNDMERLYKKATDSYEKAVQIWPDAFVTAVQPEGTVAESEAKKEVKSSEKPATASTSVNNNGKSATKEDEKSPSSKDSMKLSAPRSSEKKEKGIKMTSIKKILQYQKDVKKGIVSSSMFKSNGFAQPDRHSAVERPSSRAKNKYELARQIDSSLNNKK